MGSPWATSIYRFVHAITKLLNYKLTYIKDTEITCNHYVITAQYLQLLSPAAVYWHGVYAELKPSRIGLQ
jgi:hypothetical protein